MNSWTNFQELNHQTHIHTNMYKCPRLEIILYFKFSSRATERRAMNRKLHWRTRNNDNCNFFQSFIFVAKNVWHSSSKANGYQDVPASFYKGFFFFLYYRMPRQIVFTCYGVTVTNASTALRAVLLEKLTSAEFLNKVLHETAVMGGPRAWGAWPWDSWSLEWV